MTIGDRMIATRGRTTGFDYLRIILAVSIILWHAIITSYGPTVEAEYWRSPVGVAFRFVLPMFFALSGFLVAGSLTRSRTLVGFFALRVLRIVPALAVETLLSALILGPLLTSVTLASYFTDNLFFKYLLNIVGDVHFLLSGVFANNPNPNVVNQQLWTVPAELQCYLALGGIAAVSLLPKRWVLLVLTITFQVFWLSQISKLSPQRAPLAPGPVLVIAFLCGILLYLFRDCVRLHLSIFIACVVFGIVVGSLPNGGIYLPFPAAYMTVYIGLLNPPANRFLSSGDYSYGIYLYGYPIQQVVASGGPELQHWWMNVGITLPVALGIAVMSWHYIERPALSLRKHIGRVEAFADACISSMSAFRTSWKSAKAARVLLQLIAVGGIGLLINGTEWLGAAAVAIAMAGTLAIPADEPVPASG